MGSGWPVGFTDSHTHIITMETNRTYPITGPDNHKPGSSPAEVSTEGAIKAPLAHSGADSQGIKGTVPARGNVVVSSTGAVAEMPAEREPKVVLETPEGALRVDH